MIFVSLRPQGGLMLVLYHFYSPINGTFSHLFSVPETTRQIPWVSWKE